MCKPHQQYNAIPTSSFHDLLLISNIQISLVGTNKNTPTDPPTTSRCGPELVLINTLE